MARARQVVYAGNFAVDLESARILWILPELPEEERMIPLADGTILSWTADRLRGWEAAEGGILAAAPAAHLKELSPLALEELSARGDLGEAPAEHDFYLAVRAALQGERFDELEQRFDAYRRAKQPEECRRLLAEALAAGLPQDRHDAWAGRASGLEASKAANAAAQLERLRREEQRGLTRIADRFQQAASWCANLGRTRSATLLHADAAGIDEGRGLDLALLQEWTPASFPFRQSADRVSRWPDWLRQILPADAHFLAEEEAEFREARDAFWNEGSFALRTRNLLVLTRDVSPQDLGPCLSNGEGTIQILSELFPEARTAQHEGPMQVRIHPNRGSYEAEDEIIEQAGGAPPDPLATSALRWTLGHYTPKERISRFYVPHSSSDSEGARELHQVLAHELTHQFFNERCGWEDVFSLDTPGYWIVEGFARFIEDQAVELGRGRLQLDDATVPSVDVTAQLLKDDQLLPLEKLLTLDKRGFHKLSGSFEIPVSLKYTLESRLVSEVSIFYDQAGAFCFFLMNRGGEAGRDGLRAYLKGYYEGTLEATDWQLLGYPDLAELEAAFHAFLAEVG